MTDPYFIEPEVIQFFIDRLAAKRPGWDAPPAAAYLINPPAFVETSYKFTPYEMLLKMSAASRRLWTHGRGFETDLNTQIMGVLAQKEITREVPTIRTLWDLKRAANANLLLRVWEAIWNIEAFPRVVLGSHTYAASLMATSIPVSHVPSVHAPWSVFALDIPDGLLTLSTGHKVRRVRVLERKTDGLTEDWSLLVETEHPTEWYGSLIARLNLTADTLCRVTEMETEASLEVPSGVLLNDEHARLMTLIGRLVLNTCLALTDKESVREPSPGKGKGAEAKRRREGGPVTHNFVVGKPITIDLRERVQGYLLGHHGHGGLTVQRLVSGHWKMQAHGPGQSQRRWQWIQPYWQGPEDCPIVVRSHVIEG